MSERRWRWAERRALWARDRSRLRAAHAHAVLARLCGLISRAAAAARASSAAAPLSADGSRSGSTAARE